MSSTTTGTAVWADLTPSEQAQVLAYMALLRAGTVIKVAALNKAAALDGAWISGISDVVAKLAPTVTIPDATGLAGAQPLTASDVQAEMTSTESILAQANISSERIRYQRIVGPVNMVG